MTSLNKTYIFEPYKIIEVKYRGAEVPRPRSGHRIACDERNVYCFGGFNPSLPLTPIECRNPTWTQECPLFKELWSYSLVSRRWKHHNIIGTMPDALASSAMCINGKYLMIFGGTGAPFGTKSSNDVIIAHASGDSAKLTVLDAKGDRPPGQYGQAVVCYNGYFYSIGGTNGYAYNCDVHRLDLRKLVWEKVFVGTGELHEPLGRYRHEVIRVQNKIYVIGGGTGEMAFDLMEIPVFDLDTRSWTIQAAKADNSFENSEKIIPLPRKCHCAALLDSPEGPQVIVVGGFDGLSMFGDIWRLDVNTMQWTLMRMTVLPQPLYFHAATASSEGCMYVFGGIEPKAASICRNNILYKMWMKIPKLSEIAWEALVFYYPDLDKLDRESLRSLGIPLHLVDRVCPDNE